MILYFADRRMNILGMASTELPKSNVIFDDQKIEEVDVGVKTFDCYLKFSRKTRKQLKACTRTGNYLLRKSGDRAEFYTIIDRENDAKKRRIYIYAEDAGLDLLNEIVGAYTADKAYPAEHYVEKFAYDSGFEIGINEIGNLSRKLKWEGEATATERLLSIATQFDAELDFTFEVKNLRVTHKYINLYRKIGKDVGTELRLNRDIDNIITKESVANLATAYVVTGGTPEGQETPITLDGYQYDDGDFHVVGSTVRSRKALAKWSRYLSETGKDEGHIVKTFTYDTLSQSELCNRAISSLKKICDTEVNYEVDIAVLPPNAKIGDTVNIVDDEDETYLSARILKMTTSETRKERTAVLGEYLIKSGGINQKLEELAEQFKNIAAGRTLYTWTVYADDEQGGGITIDPAGKKYMGISNNNFVIEPDLSRPEIYKWSLIKGEDGKPGESGKSFYTWIKFADDENGNDMSDLPDGKQYLGIAYNKETPEKSENPKDYAWARITGEGIPGAPGEDGKTYYTWVRYADNEYGSGMSDTPDGKAYIGFAFNKESPTESNNPADYKWSKIKGDDGAEGKPGKPGEPGKDGKGIESIIEYYLTSASNSGITTSSYGWSTEIPTMTPEKKYLWNYEEIQYNDGTSEKKTPKIIGAYGNTGEEGVGIKNIVNYYLATSLGSGVTTSTYGWTTTKQDMTETKRYLWNYEVITYTNDTRYQSPLTIIGVYGQTGEPGKNNLIVSPTAPENPVVGQLWQTASGDAIKRWDGKQWVMHYLSVDNLKADVLSAITANLGEVIAGILRDKSGMFSIDLNNSVIRSIKNNQSVELTEGELRFTEQIDQLQVLATYTASRIMYRLADTSGEMFSMQYISGEGDVLVSSDRNGDYYLGKTLKKATEKPVVLARCISTSFQQFTIEDYQNFRYLILITAARMGSTLYRPLAECTIHPEIFLHCNAQNGGAIACYAEEPGNYRAELMAVDATTIRLRCKSSFDMAVLLGVR